MKRQCKSGGVISIEASQRFYLKFENGANSRRSEETTQSEPESPNTAQRADQQKIKTKLVPGVGVEPT